MGCYIRCIHQDESERYEVPHEISNAGSTEIARSRCEELRRILERIYGTVTNGYKVERLADSNALLGKILRKRPSLRNDNTVEWNLFKRPSAEDQRNVYNQWRANNLSLPNSHQQLTEIGLLKELASYQVSTLGLPPPRRRASQFLTHITPWPNRAHREPQHDKDDGEYEWQAASDPYEPRNCLQNIYDKNGYRIGRQSVVRNEWSGLRLVQCKNSPYNVTGWYYVQYPEEWHFIQHDFELMAAYWRANEIIEQAIQIFPNDFMLFAETTPQIKAARRIVQEYLRYYNKDGSKIGHNHEQSMRENQRRRQSMESSYSRSSGGSPHRNINNRNYGNWSRRSNRTGYQDDYNYNDENWHNQEYDYDVEEDERLNNPYYEEQKREDPQRTNRPRRDPPPHSSPNAPSPNTSDQRSRPRTQQSQNDDNMEQDQDSDLNQDNAPDVD